MSEVVIKEIAGSHDTEINGETMYVIFLLADGNGGTPEKVRVLAKKEDKWKPGDRAILEAASSNGFEGPDGEKDWTYCRLKLPQKQGGGNTRFFGGKRSTSGGSPAPATAPVDRLMPTVPHSEASAAYDDFIQEAAVGIGNTMDALLGNFGEAKPTPDAVLQAATSLTVNKANALFAAYIKSFRVAYQSSKA